ncbi:MAG: hypothetical protein ACTSVZ_12465 [Promethearchaeota archaeon]
MTPKTHKITKASINLKIPEGPIQIRDHRILVEGKPFFIQGMNLFLDAFRLEKNPRLIYTPPVVSETLVSKIIPHLQECGINTVRIWPTIINGRHQASISDEGLYRLQDAGFHLLLNLPVNWNLKPPISDLKEYLERYNPINFPGIAIYCINNECYHGFRSPHRYLDAVHHLTRRITQRPTLVTNANLNRPWYFGSDLIGADFFTYRYSISSQGYDDVGAVARMFLEDAAELYRLFPRVWIQFYPLFERYLRYKAQRNNFDPKYFQQNLLKVLKQTQKVNKPYVVCEYGYTDDPDQLEIIFAHMPVQEMQGHIWYNWSNFDPKVEGKITNRPLFNNFKDICHRLARIKHQS